MNAAQHVVGLYCHKGALLAHIQLTVHQEPQVLHLQRCSPAKLTLTYAGPSGGSIFCFPRSQGFLLLSSETGEKPSQLTRASQETLLPLTSLTCGAGTLFTGPSSNIGGGGGGGGEGKTSSGAGGKGSSKGGGGGGKAQFEEKLASSPGGGGGGGGSSMGKNENKSKFGSFLTFSQYKLLKES